MECSLIAPCIPPAVALQLPLPSSNAEQHSATVSLLSQNEFVDLSSHQSCRMSRSCPSNPLLVKSSKTSPALFYSSSCLARFSGARCWLARCSIDLTLTISTPCQVSFAYRPSLLLLVLNFVLLPLTGSSLSPLFSLSLKGPRLLLFIPSVAILLALVSFMPLTSSSTSTSSSPSLTFSASPR